MFNFSHAYNLSSEVAAMVGSCSKEVFLPASACCPCGCRLNYWYSDREEESDPRIEMEKRSGKRNMDGEFHVYSWRRMTKDGKDVCIFVLCSIFLASVLWYVLR